MESTREPDSRAYDGERARDVFHHPYASAAWHRIPTRPAMPALAVT
jgi:hypothetical protein